MGVAYIYGAHNGASYTEGTSGQKDVTKTHWDPRISVQSMGGHIQIGVVPPSKERSTEEEGAWVSDDGQFLSLDRSGMSRLITALQDAAVSTFGRDPW